MAARQAEEDSARDTERERGRERERVRETNGQTNEVNDREEHREREREIDIREKPSCCPPSGGCRSFHCCRAAVQVSCVIAGALSIILLLGAAVQVSCAIAGAPIISLLSGGCYRAAVQVSCAIAGALSIISLLSERLCKYLVRSRARCLLCHCCRATPVGRLLSGGSASILRNRGRTVDNFPIVGAAVQVSCVIAAAFSIISAMSGGCASIHYDVTAVGRLSCVIAGVLIIISPLSV